MTLLKSLNRLLDLHEAIKVSGEVLIDGENICSPKTGVTHLRKRIGLLSQRPQPLPMSIYDNIAYGPRIHSIRDRKALDRIIEDKLRTAGLWEEVKDRLTFLATGLSIPRDYDWEPVLRFGWLIFMLFLVDAYAMRNFIINLLN